MATLAVLNQQGKKIEELELDEKVFTGRVNTAVLHQAVIMYQAGQRQGNASTKERGSVSGGGKKPWRQKGTGRARAGSTRSPSWVHGGVVFGPHPREFSYQVPKLVRAGALRESLNAKFQAKMLFCLQDVKDKVAKTKDFAKIMAALGIKGRCLIALDGCDVAVVKACRNLPRVSMVAANDVTAYDVLSHKGVLLTKTAFNKILKRI